MNKLPQSVVSSHESPDATRRMYVTGFMLSLYLTISCYVVVVYHLFPKLAVLIVIFGLAIIQFIVQIYYFLHLGRDTKPRWKVLMLYFMLLVVTILVGGSIWIMTHLNSHHYMNNDKNGYSKEEGI